MQDYIFKTVQIHIKRLEIRSTGAEFNLAKCMNSFSRMTERDASFLKKNPQKNECKVANKVSVCFEWLWKGPFVWLCLLLSRKRTFPRVLFILIVLFLPLSSSRFWQTQSSKCGQTCKSEFCPFVSSCLFLFTLYALCIFPSPSLSSLNNLSLPGPLLSLVPRGHGTAVWQNEIRTTEVLWEIIHCEILGWV